MLAWELVSVFNSTCLDLLLQIVRHGYVPQGRAVLFES
jgi:hypothetical protein